MRNLLLLSCILLFISNSISAESSNSYKSEFEEWGINISLGTHKPNLRTLNLESSGPYTPGSICYVSACGGCPGDTIEYRDLCRADSEGSCTFCYCTTVGCPKDPE